MSRLLPALLVGFHVLLARGEMIVIHEETVDPLSLKLFRLMTVSGSRTQPGHFQLSVGLRPTPATPDPISDPKKAGSVTPEEAVPPSVAGLQIVVAEKAWFDASKKDSFCCTLTDVGEGKCQNEMDFRGAGVDGSTNIGGEASTGAHAYRFPVTKEETISKKLPFVDEGMYYVGLAHCGDQSIAGWTVHGEFQAKSSHGYLSAMDVGALHWQAVLGLIHLAILLAWACMCFKWKEQLGVVHHVLTLVICVCLLSSASRYGIYFSRNTSEVSPEKSQVVSQLLEVCQFGAGLVVVVMICLGYGTAHQSLDHRDLPWLFLYGSLFCICAGCRSLMMSQHLDVFLESVLPLGGLADVIISRTAIVLPEAIVFGAISNWGYTSFINIESVLREQKQHEALKIFSSLGNSLKIGVWSFILLMLVQICAQQLVDVGQVWRSLWVVDEALPDAIYLSCLSWTLYSFWPNEHSKIKAMSQQINYDDAELDEIMEGIDLEQPEEGEIEMAEVESRENRVLE